MAAAAVKDPIPAAAHPAALKCQVFMHYSRTLNSLGTNDKDLEDKSDIFLKQILQGARW